MENISSEEFKKRYLNGEVKLLIDVRSPGEYAQLHVERAINLPLPELHPDQVRPLLVQREVNTIYLICRSGGRSQKAGALLDAAGVTGCVSVDGGTDAAKECGLTCHSAGSNNISLERQVRIGAGFLVFFGSLLSFSYPAFIAVPLFVGAGLVFAGVTDWCGMGLFLAQCPWNRSSKGKK